VQHEVTELVGDDEASAPLVLNVSTDSDAPSKPTSGHAAFGTFEFQTCVMIELSVYSGSSR